jgi:hypothetical protein
VTDIGPVNPETGNKPVWFEDDNYREVMKPYRTSEGDPLYSYWLVKTDGLFQTDAEAAAYVDKNSNRIQPNAKAGDLRFIDQNGDGKIDDNDRISMGAYYPKLTYALSAGFTWKNLSFNLMLQGVSGSKIFQAWNYSMLNESYGNWNRLDNILEAWPNGNRIPRVSNVDANNNFGTHSDFYLEDGSYLRIKNINLAYTFDDVLQSLSSNLRERKSALSLYLSVDNLYTFTKYTGMNPEVGSKGLDQGKYPVPTVVSVGVKLTY